MSSSCIIKFLFYIIPQIQIFDTKWNTNWGAGSTSGEGIALVSFGSNISFKAANAGSYTFNFNENTKTYSVESTE
ncbi:hypothetical protein [uncultured Treponema sp.]|uniref:hypothetical protein n=1 Tax=uncultured Treponema sp. TaxID=162155 RepID=UPI0025D449F9|nr:hypothetical protein [uncultured Treponema sp.]